MGIENPIHLLFLGAVALLVLGPKRLPDLAKALGNGIREFRESITDGEDGEKPAPANGTATAATAATAVAAAAAHTPAAPAAPPPPAEQPPAVDEPASQNGVSTAPADPAPPPPAQTPPPPADETG
jgi:sec-independent protein translocase protein TatA